MPNFFKGWLSGFFVVVFFMPLVLKTDFVVPSSTNYSLFTCIPIGFCSQSVCCLCWVLCVWCVYECVLVCGVVCVASADGQVSGLEIGECTRMFESVRMGAKRFIFVVMFRRSNSLKWYTLCCSLILYEAFVSPLKTSDMFEQPIDIVIMKMFMQVCNDCMNITVWT